MASLQRRNGNYRVLFRYHGKQHAFTIGDVTDDEAEAKAAQVDYLLMRLKQRLATIPPGVDIVDYVQFDGKTPVSAEVPETTLGSLRDQYLATHERSLEPTTVNGLRLHFKHLVGHFGERFPVGELSLASLQRYVDARVKSSGVKGRKLSPATVRKEIVSLRTAWNWAVRMKLVVGKFPHEGLRYPKSTEKPPFQTRAEIERAIKSGGLNDAEQSDLWDALYLQVDEVEQLLAYVESHARHPFIHPMVCTAAYTGARRSELIRLKLSDLDFASKTITIHERKRVRGRITTRRVPMSPRLVDVLRIWTKIHPGGPFLFCHAGIVDRSSKRSRRTGYMNPKTRPKTESGRAALVTERPIAPIASLTPKEAHDHFRRTLADSIWNVVRGWHSLRHSFISALASGNIDQRLIDEFVGHQSEEQRRRYRHLYPSVKERAIADIFSAKGRRRPPSSSH